MTDEQRAQLVDVRERLATAEAKIESVRDQTTRMEKKQDEMYGEIKANREDTKAIREALAQGRGFRLGLLAALPAGGGAIGAFITNWLKSGGPTG